jgi:type I restriction enzyme S subunit
MREGWEYKKLGSLCKTGAGGTPLKSKKENYESGTIPWLRSGEVNNRNITDCEIRITQTGLNNSSAKLFPPRTVLIAMYGATAGQVGILNFECSTNQAVCGILPNEKFVPEFLYYYFLKFKEELIAQAVGGAQPNISQQKIKNTLVPNITLEEQKKIVAILDKAFTAIDQAKANIEKNIENAKELFQSKLNDIFSQKGDGWVEKTLGEIANVNYGFTDKSTSAGDYRYIRITDIDQNGELDESGKVYIKSTEKALEFILKNNDLLMARTGATFAKTLLYKDYEPSIFASYLIKISFKENISNELYWYFTKSGNYWEQANNLSSGSAQPHFNGAALKKVKLSYPKDTKKQNDLIDIIKGFDLTSKKVISIYEQKLTNLDDLKKSILKKAFEGELTKEEVTV